MKKLLAIFLAIICVFSAFAVPASAMLNEDLLGDILNDQLGLPEQEEDPLDAIEYGIYYDMEMLSTVTLIYKPTHTLALDAPKDVVVTGDYPIAVDHNWVCWKDQATGQLYYPGDVITVNGKVTLVAVWEEKTDNYPSFFRSVIAGLQAFMRIIDKFLGVFDAINATKPTEATTEAVETTTA